MGEWGGDAGVVRLPDDRLLRGTGRRRPAGRAPPPDFAVYLLGRDPHVDGWTYRWIENVARGFA